MFTVFKPGSNYQFIAKARTWLTMSAVGVAIAIVILIFKGPNFGLDFTGGHELLLEFEKPVKAEEVRAAIDKLRLGDTSVQSYAEKTKPDHTYFLVRVQRSETFGAEEIAGLENAFKQKYGQYLQRMRYNPEAGDVVEVELTATATAAAGVDTSTHAIAAIVESTNHEVRQVRPIGRGDAPRYAVVLRGIDASVLTAVSELDPKAAAPKIEFVGPTVGAQLRNDGILAMTYALLLMLVYIALRFDIYYAPGAVLCLFQNALITVGLMALLGQEFSLTTIAAILTLIGYSLNDTIVVFDRVRETVGKASGAALADVVNKAINETLSRTVMTSTAVIAGCLFLMGFGSGTVLYQFGFIMLCGVVIGTFSSICVAAPIFVYLRDRFGPKEINKIPRLERKGAKASREASPQV